MEKEVENSVTYLQIKKVDQEPEPAKVSEGLSRVVLVKW